MSEKSRTALRTAASYSLLDGIPEIHFLQYAYTAKKPLTDNAFLWSCASVNDDPVETPINSRSS